VEFSSWITKEWKRRIRNRYTFYKDRSHRFLSPLSCNRAFYSERNSALVHNRHGSYSRVTCAVNGKLLRADEDQRTLCFFIHVARMDHLTRLADCRTCKWKHRQLSARYRADVSGIVHKYFYLEFGESFVENENEGVGIMLTHTLWYADV